MSDTSSNTIDPTGKVEKDDPWGGLKSRAKWYASLTLGLILLIAWIDGGEEPLHLIVQPIELSEGR